MVRKNSATSWALLLVPLLVTIMLIRILTPLQLLFADSWYFEWMIYAAALGLGYTLYSRSRTVRDYEWQRQKAMQSVNGHIRAEERGVWETDVAVPTGLGEEGEVALRGAAGSLASERETAEITEENDGAEINLLVEQDHVVKSTRRVSGQDTYDYEAVEATSGVVRRKGAMDRLIDWFGSRVAQRKKVEAEAEPSEPAPPVKPDTAESVKSYDPSLTIGGEPVATAVPSPESQPRPEPIQVDPQVAVIYGTGSDSMESLASLATPSSSGQTASYDPTGTGVVSSGYAINRCTECGFSNPSDTRYCEQCGTRL